MDTSTRRGRILAAALQCFNEHGIEAAAISDICARSAASIGSVYHHFGSKEGIAVALLVEGMGDNARQLEQRLAATSGARAGVATVVGSLIDWIAVQPAWARFIYSVSRGAIREAGSTGLTQVNQYYAQVIADYFGPYLAAGAFRPLPQECFAPLVIGPVHYYARRWLNGQAQGDIRDYKTVFAQAAWDAVKQPRRP